MRKIFEFVVLAIALSSGLWAQQTSVAGTVTDESGLPLPGATILVENTNRGVTSDFDGNFSISASNGEVLIVSYVGYQSSQITVEPNANYSISLAPQGQLEEVVITALGQSKIQRKLGYSAQTVSNENIQNSGQDNIVNALNGNVAGVNIVSSSGAAGASANIVIRGASSILGNNQPLFVIDGIPIDNSTDPSNETGSVNGLDFKDYGKVIGSNRAADINPDDIASLTVLKGGAATALYGIRAVNGAIIITTKSGMGAEEGLNLNFSTGYSVDVVNKYPQFTEKYTRGRNGLYSNITHWSWGPAYSDNPVFPSGTILDLDGDGTREDISGQTIPLYRNNYKNFFQNGFKTNNNLSVSKATDAGSFYMSLGNIDQEGVVANNTYNRSNFSLKGSFNINDNFKIGGLANFANVKGVNFQGGDTGFGSGLSYYHHMWDIKNRPWIDGNSERTWFSAFVADPKWIINEEGENSEVDRLIGNLNLSYNFFPWLRLNAIGGIDTFSDQRKLVRPISSVNTVGRNGDLYEIKTNSKDVTFNVNVSGDLSINDDLSFNYLAGLDYYDKKYNRLFLSGTELLVKNFNDISNAKNYNANRIDANKRIVGFFGELNFDYKNFLFLSITGRNDWSSTLPKENNSFFYPSISSGFVFTELLTTPVLSYGKLKLSWAQIGNDAPVFSTTNVFTRETPNVNLNQPQFTISDTQNNPNIKPELSVAYEAGIELGLFDNFVNLETTYYEIKTLDQILPVPLSETTGFAEFINNSGEIKNSGWEVVLGFNNILSNSNKIRWNLDVNFYKNQSKVVSVPEGLEEIIVGYGYWNSTKLVARPGYPLGTFIGNGYKRNDEGELLLNDNGYPQIEEDQILGNYNPDYILNFINAVSFDNFTLSANFEIKQGGRLYNDAEISWIYSGLSATTGERFYSADNSNANATRVFDGIIESTGQKSTIAAPLDNTYYHQIYNNIDENFAEDASWLRLRSINLSYEFPTELLKNTFINRLRITATGRNLWLDTKYKGIDPETGALGAGNIQGFNTITAPNTKSYGLNLDIKF